MVTADGLVFIAVLFSILTSGRLTSRRGLRSRLKADRALDFVEPKDPTDVIQQ